MPEENEFDFLPEECRASKTRDKCLATYHAVRSCFEIDYNERVPCAKNKVSLGDIADEKRKCQDAACVDALRSKVFDVVKFRIYDLEYKAQELKGVDEMLVLDFIEAAEQKKIDFNEAQTIAFKKLIVRDVIDLWNEFVAKAKPQVKR